jgi:osmoprotectant transport system permease protein
LSDLLAYMANNVSLILKYGETHFSLIFSAVVVSLLLWIPLGILISRNERLAGIVLGIANTLFCIPSLALFAIFVTVPFIHFFFTDILLYLSVLIYPPKTTNNPVSHPPLVKMNVLFC